MLSELNQQHQNCRISSGTVYLFDGNFNLRRIASLAIQYISFTDLQSNDITMIRVKLMLTSNKTEHSG